MSLDAYSIAEGMIAGHGVSLARQVVEGEKNPTRPDIISLLEEQNRLLYDIVQAVNGNVHPAKNVTVTLFPTDYNDYIIQDYGYNHVSLFSAVSFQLVVKVPGLAAYKNTIPVGWSQIDLSYGAALSTGDSTTNPVIFSYRDDAIGSAL